MQIVDKKWSWKLINRQEIENIEIIGIIWRGESIRIEIEINLFGLIEVITWWIIGLFEWKYEIELIEIGRRIE